MRNPQTRLNVYINSQTRTALEQYAASRHVSITEALRNLIGYGAFVNDAVESGHEVLLRADGNTERVWLAR